VAIAPPAKIVPPAKIAQPPENVATPVAAESDRRSSAVPETAEESPNFFDERFDFEEPFDLLESAEPPAAEPGAPAREGEPEERRPRRRHRRRRRGREPEPRDATQQAVSEEAADRSGSMAPAAEAGEAPAVDSERPRDEAAAETEERRARRRRPHRGKKRPRGDEPDRTAAGGTVGAEAASEFPEQYEAETVGAGVLAGEAGEPGEGDEVEGEPSARLGFRGIPTWEETIGLIVDKNLEARSRRPGGGPRSGRGSHGPRNDRGRGGKRRPS